MKQKHEEPPSVEAYDQAARIVAAFDRTGAILPGMGQLLKPALAAGIQLNIDESKRLIVREVCFMMASLRQGVQEQYTRHKNTQSSEFYRGALAATDSTKQVFDEFLKKIGFPTSEEIMKSDPVSSLNVPRTNGPVRG